MGSELWIVLLVAASAVSGWAGYFWASRRAPRREELDALTAELHEARQKVETVQAGVSEHFEQSARLFGKLAGDYREFLEHFAGSAQALGLSESRTRELVTQSFQPLLTHEVDDLVVSADAAEAADAASPEQDGSVGAAASDQGGATAASTTRSEPVEPDATVAEPPRARVAEVELPSAAGAASGKAEASDETGEASEEKAATGTTDEPVDERPASADVRSAAAGTGSADVDVRGAGADGESAGQRQRAGS